MTPAQLQSLPRLKKKLPGEIILEPRKLAAYAGDKWFATHRPEAVALPRSTKSVSAILRFASRHKIPVTARGGGYGYVGGCVPVRGGIVLSLERMKKILEINAADFVAVVQPGVTLIELVCVLVLTAPLAVFAARGMSVAINASRSGNSVSNLFAALARAQLCRNRRCRCGDVSGH